MEETPHSLVMPGTSCHAMYIGCTSLDQPEAGVRSCRREVVGSGHRTGTACQTLVQWFRNTSCTEGAEAPVWPGATKEQIGNL